MSLLVIGIAVGLVAALLLRTLVQYERQGLARVADGLEQIEGHLAELEERVRSLEAIAAEDEGLADAIRPSETEPASGSPERREHA